MEPPVLQFETPSSLLVCGPSNSGKTSFVKRLLENASLMFKTPPKYILYCYGSVWQPIFDEMEKCVKNIRFFKGLPTEDEFLDIRDSNDGHFVCVLDDLMSQSSNSSFVEKIVYAGSHHLNMTIVCLMQNLYQKGKVMRTISLNMHYYILFENRRDMEQILRFGRQVLPHQSKFFFDSYKKSTISKYGYLLVDLNPHTDKLYSLRTRIFPEEDTIVYRPSNEGKGDKGQ